MTTSAVTELDAAVDRIINDSNLTRARHDTGAVGVIVDTDKAAAYIQQQQQRHDDDDYRHQGGASSTIIEEEHDDDDDEDDDDVFWYPGDAYQPEPRVMTEEDIELERLRRETAWTPGTSSSIRRDDEDRRQRQQRSHWVYRVFGCCCGAGGPPPSSPKQTQQRVSSATTPSVSLRLDSRTRSKVSSDLRGDPTKRKSRSGRRKTPPSARDRLNTIDEKRTVVQPLKHPLRYSQVS